MSNLHDVSWGTRPEVEEVAAAAAAESTHGTNEKVVNSPLDMKQFRKSLEGESGAAAAAAAAAANARGGQGGVKDREARIQVQQRSFMLKTMGLWAISNVLLVLLMGGEGGTAYTIVPAEDFMNFTMGILFSSMIIRVMGSTYYAWHRYVDGMSPWWSCCKRRA